MGRSKTNFFGLLPWRALPIRKMVTGIVNVILQGFVLVRLEILAKLPQGTIDQIGDAFCNKNGRLSTKAHIIFENCHYKMVNQLGGVLMSPS